MRPQPLLPWLLPNPALLSNPTVVDPPAHHQQWHSAHQFQQRLPQALAAALITALAAALSSLPTPAVPAPAAPAPAATTMGVDNEMDRRLHRAEKSHDSEGAQGFHLALLKARAAENQRTTTTNGGLTRSHSHTR